MMAGLDDVMYQFDFDLESTLSSILGDLNVKPELAKSFSPIAVQLRTQERQTKENIGFLNTCKSQLDKLEQEILEAGKTNGECVIPEACESDTDVQYMQVDYTPHSQLVTMVTTTQASAPIPTQMLTTQANSIKSLLMTPSSGPRASILSATKTSTPTYNKPPDSSINKSPCDDVTIISAAPRTSFNEPRKIIVPQMAVGLKVLARKHNEIWYRGNLLEIQHKDLQPEERRYKIKFDGKGGKVVKGTEIAYADLSLPYLPVGSRVVALYHDPNGITTNYAGIVAEPPSVRNTQRFLIFFDDGYAQYCYPKQVSKVYHQSRNVWEDIHEDSQDFIREYLQQYPDRPMVRLQKGQVVKTEWSGKWWTAKVTEVDASLVKMFFEADKRTEWVYRGSTRLGPLYTELANAEQARQSGKGRRHHIQAKNSKRPYVEYTRLDSEDKKAPSPAVSTKKETEQQKTVKQVAKKSTGKPQVEKPPEGKKREFEASSISSNKTGRDIASVLQERLASGATLDEMSGERMNIDISLPNENKPRKTYVTHKCRPVCLKDADDDPAVFKGHNTLLIPLLCGWERQLGKSKGGRRSVFYRAPCGRRLRSMEETDYYLMRTQSKLTIDLFCFEMCLHTNKEFVPIKTFCDIKDLSYGKENVPISCVNGVDRQYPDYVEYSNQRLPAKGVKLNLDKDFLVCCSCTDGCRNKAKCECWQMTHEAFMAANNGEKDPNIGYIHRRLSEQVITGIYECNPRCNCDARCANRVAQNGLQLRLQVFKTEKRGWGLRCLDDIPKGGFICIYAGQLLTEQGANEDGQAYGDEYLAELDYIEVVEKVKEGYEEDAESDEGIGKETETTDSDEDEDEDSEAGGDAEYSADSSGSSASARGQPSLAREISTRRKVKDIKTQSSKTSTPVTKDVTKTPGWQLPEGSSAKCLKNIADWVNKIPTPGESIIIVDSEDENDVSQPQSTSQDSMETSMELPDVLGGKPTNQSSVSKSANQSIITGGTLTSDLVQQESGGIPKLRIHRVDSDMSTDKDGAPGSFSTLQIGDVRTDADDDEDEEGKRITRSRTKNQFLMTPKAQKMAPDGPAGGHRKEEEEEERKPMRSYFGENEMCYIMDAKSIGNIGRYLNHNCSPNVFVQNVFVDTHDLRFPWVAFFASQYIRAGTELTWDYNYEVGSVPGKILYCYCGAADCRGRLL